MRQRIIQIILGLCLLSQVSAQESYDPYPAKMLGASFDGLIPISGFKEGVGDQGVNGYSFNYYKQIDTSAYSFMGLEFNYNHIGSFANRIDSGTDSFEDLTSSDFITILLIYRHFSPIYKKYFEPFIQGGLGPQFFFTTTSTSFLDGSGDTDFRFEENSTGLAYEVGLGAMSNVYKGLNVFFVFSFRGGSSVSYLIPDPNGLSTEYPIDSFLSRRDAPNLLRLQFGISYSF